MSDDKTILVVPTLESPVQRQNHLLNPGRKGRTFRVRTAAPSESAQYAPNGNRECERRRRQAAKIAARKAGET